MSRNITNRGHRLWLFYCIYFCQYHRHEIKKMMLKAGIATAKVAVVLKSDLTQAYNVKEGVRVHTVAIWGAGHMGRTVFGIIEIQRTAAKMSQEKLKIKKA